jgi:DNA-binding XRE family transcriptional regulator
MRNLKQSIDKRGKRDQAFASGFETGYATFKIGILLRQARESAGLTQEEVARRLNTQKSAISRIENHADDVRLATLMCYASLVGLQLRVRLTV